MAQANPFDALDDTSSAGANPFDHLDKPAKKPGYLQSVGSAISGAFSEALSAVGKDIEAQHGPQGSVADTFGRSNRGVADLIGLVTKPVAAGFNAAVVEPAATALDAIPLPQRAPITWQDVVSGNPHPDRILTPEEAHAQNVRDVGTGLSLVMPAEAGSLTALDRLHSLGTTSDAALFAAAQKAGLSVSAYRQAAALGEAAKANKPGLLAPFAARVSDSAAERQAGQTLQRAATDPGAVRASLANGPDELVPGSQPTTFQQTGDMGLGSLERADRTANPGLYQQRAAEQNAARVDAMPQPGGDPAQVASSFRAHLDALDAETQAAVDAATAKASEATTAAGGEGTPEATGAALRDSITEAESAARAREGALWEAIDPDGAMTGNVTATRTAAEDIVKAEPPTAQPMGPQEAAVFNMASTLPDVVPVRNLTALRSWVSTALREELRANGRSPAYARLSRLRGAIQDNLTTTIGDVAHEQAGPIGRGELPLEDSVAGKIDQWAQENAPGGPDLTDQALNVIRRGGKVKAEQGPSLLDFLSRNGGIRDDGGELSALDADRWHQGRPFRPRLLNENGMDLSTAAEKAQDAGYLGVRDTRQAYEGGDEVATHQQLVDAIQQELAGHPVHAREAVNEDLAAHVRDLDEMLGSLGINPATTPNSVIRDALDAEFGVTTQRAYGTGRTSAPRAAAVPAGTTGRSAQPHGAGLPQAGGPGSPAGDTGFPGDQPRAIIPTFDEAAGERLATATQATRERARTFGVQPVSNVTATVGEKGQFRLPDGQVPAKFFKPGPGGYEAMQAAIKAGGDRAAQILEDYAAMSLRRAADPGATGVLDPKAFARWKAAHQDALRALPEAARGRFNDAGEAGKAVQEAAQNRAAALKEAQAGAIGKIMGLSEPEDITRAIGRIFGKDTAVSDMKALVAQAKRDPAAFKGLRQAVADYISGQFIGNTEVAASGQAGIKADAFQTFVRKNSGALKQVFTDEELTNLHAIAADIQRAKRSETAIKLPGGSNTAQDTVKGRLASVGTRSVLDIIGAALGAHFGGGEIGAAAGVAVSEAVQALRAQGVARVDALVTKALLDPALARSLLAKAPEAKPATPAFTTGWKVRNRAVIAALGANAAREQEP